MSADVIIASLYKPKIHVSCAIWQIFNSEEKKALEDLRRALRTVKDADVDAKAA
jgi:hypothetical protein